MSVCVWEREGVGREGVEEGRGGMDGDNVRVRERDRREGGKREREREREKERESLEG